MYKSLAIALFLVAPAHAGAQTVLPSPASPIQPLNTGTAVLRTGTEVNLTLSEELTTKNKKLKSNQRFKLEVSESISVQGVVVVPAGSIAVGEVTEVRNSGMWGKSGYFQARILYVTVNGRQIRLTGNFDKKGTAGGVGAVAVSAIVFAPAGFFMKGTSALLPVGTPVKAFIDEDVPLAMPVQDLAPLQVGAPQAPTATTAVAPAPEANPVPAGN